MKKVFLFSIIAVSMLSCQHNSAPSTDSLASEITYFKDRRTNLCFGAINSRTADSYEVTSITCVPCESVGEYIK